MSEIGDATTEAPEPDEKTHKIIQEIISLERLYYFEKKNVKSERQKKVKDIIERHSGTADGE